MGTITSANANDHGIETDTLMWARWTTKNQMGEYMAQVSATGEQHEAGKWMWAWMFVFNPTDEQQEWTASTSNPFTNADTIHVPDRREDPKKVLATLSSFLDAWGEALGRTGGGENDDLFPTAAEFMLSVVEEFVMDMMDATDPDDSADPENERESDAG